MLIAVYKAGKCLDDECFMSYASVSFSSWWYHFLKEDLIYSFVVVLNNESNIKAAPNGNQIKPMKSFQRKGPTKSVSTYKNLDCSTHCNNHTNNFNRHASICNNKNTTICNHNKTIRFFHNCNTSASNNRH